MNPSKKSQYVHTPQRFLIPSFFFQEDDPYDLVDTEQLIDERLLLSFSNKQQHEQCYSKFQSIQSDIYKLKQSQKDSKDGVVYRRTIDELDDIDPESHKFMILNQDTGILIDARIEEEVITLQDSKTLKNTDNQYKAWQDFWARSQKLISDLLDAVRKGDTEKVQQILNVSQDSYIDINFKGQDDWTPLHHACDQNNQEITNVLIQHQALVDVINNQKRTPLHISVMKGNLSITTTLLEHMADPNAQDIELFTPLHIASIPTVIKIQSRPINEESSKLGLLRFEFKCLSLQNIFEQWVFIELGLNLIVINQINEYRRIIIPGTNCVLKNGRHDHVTKILNLTKAISYQKNTIKMKQPSNPLNKWHNFIFRKIHLTQNVSSESGMEFRGDQLEKVSCRSFIFYQMLGRGSFGEIYLVEKIDTQKKYSMKIMKKEHIQNQNLMEYVKTEKDILCQMNHPFIVKLDFAFQTHKKLFLVMEFCPGGDLSELLDMKHKLSEDIVRIYIAELLLALEALHANRIIYRDLKPENVVLDEQGHAMLIDFGLSKKGVDHLIKHNSFCGTAAYLAPEMISRQGHNKQVDWYLLGVLMYELLVGIPPYFDNEREIMFENIRRGPLKLPKSMSQDAKDLLLKLLLRDPEKRLGSKRDGEELREHPWFVSIDWLDCYNRKLIPPQPEIINFGRNTLNMKFPKDVDGKNKLQGWTFIEQNLQL